MLKKSKKEQKEEKNFLKSKSAIKAFLVVFVLVDLLILAFIYFSSTEEEKLFNNFEYSYLNKDIQGEQKIIDFAEPVLQANFISSEDDKDQKLAVLLDDKIKLLNNDFGVEVERGYDFSNQSYRFNDNLLKSYGFSGAGKYYYYVDSDGTFRLYNTFTGESEFEEKIVNVDLVEGEIENTFLDNLYLGYSADLLAVSRNDKIEVWDVSDEEVYKTFRVSDLKPSDFVEKMQKTENASFDNGGYASKILLSKDNTKLISFRVEMDTVIKDLVDSKVSVAVDVWDIKEEEKLVKIREEFVFDKSEKEATSIFNEDLGLDYDGRSDLVMFSVGQNIYIYNSDGEKVNQVDTQKIGFSDLKFGLKEKTLVLSHKGLDSLEIWNFENAEKTKTIYTQTGLNGFDIDYINGRFLTFGRNQVVIWGENPDLSSQNGKLGYKKSIIANQEAWGVSLVNTKIKNISFSPDSGKVLFTSQKGDQVSDKTIQVWDYKNKTKIFDYENYSDSVGGQFVSNDKVLFMAGGLADSKFPEISRLVLTDLDGKDQDVVDGESGVEALENSFQNKEYFCEKGLPKRIEKAGAGEKPDYSWDLKAFTVLDEKRVLLGCVSSGEDKTEGLVIELDLETDKRESLYRFATGKSFGRTDRFVLNETKNVLQWKGLNENYLINLKDEAKKISISKEFGVTNFYDYYLIRGTQKVVFFKNLDAKRISLEVRDISDPKVIDVNTIDKPEVEEDAVFQVLGFNPEKNLVAYYTKNYQDFLFRNRVVLYDLKNKQVFDSIDLVGDPNLVSFNQDGSIMSVSSGTGFVRFFELD